MLYVWEIELEKHYADDEVDEWLDITSDYRVVAPDYYSAFAEAKTLAFSEPFHNDDEDTDVAVDNVRILSIKRGATIDAVANGVAA